MTGKLLIAGVGNIFLSDDGFGVEVASRLAGCSLPTWADVVDYGIRGIHLAYDLASGYDSAILIDATQRGGAPGTVYVIEPDPSVVPAGASPAGDEAEGLTAQAASPLLDAHGMQPDVVLQILGLLEDSARTRADGRIIVVGCEPATAEYGIGLSEPVAAAVDEAMRVVLDLVAAAGSRPDHQLAAKEWSHVPRHSR
ncbi:MAG TPA: hydrogenase maturation protease [Streptosporangiaceae bacterium]